MAKQIFQYTVPTIYQDGLTCPNPEVSFDIPECIDTPCTITGNTITIELDPDDTTCNCIYVIINCPDDCDLCDPVVIKKCFCNSNDDCPACHECDNDNICQPLCPDKICVDDYCADCEIDSDCDYNQICFNGECICPPGTVKDSLGRCVECLIHDDCDECESCVGGNCVPKCPSNFCIDGNCTGCLIDSDCTEPNHCCSDEGQCVCCPGYIWDPFTETCIVQPDCVTSRDCPDCYNCVETVGGKKCEPTTCPPGYIAYFDGVKCCHRECNCSNPSCPAGQYCVEILNGKCICTDSPCQGPCSGPEDCGNGCGCLDGQCVDCKNLNCDTDNECERALGCECTSNNTCQKTNNCTNQPCVTPSDCPHNCGCKNNDCVDCGDFICSEPDHCPFGCYCDQGIGKCRPNPCVEVYCETGDECGPGCGCDPTSNRCIPCSSVNCDYCEDLSGCHCPDGSCVEDPDDSCKDTLAIEKDETTCDIIVTASTNDCCGCDDWELQDSATAIIQGTGTTKDKFTHNTTLANVNTVPVNWDVSVVVNYNLVHEVKEVVRDSGGNFVGYNPAADIVESFTVTFLGQPSLTSSTQRGYWRPGRKFTQAGKEYETVKVSLYATITGAQETAAQCEYLLGKSLIFELNTTTVSNTEVLEKTTCKNPIITLYRSDDDIFTTGDQVVRFYIKQDPTAGTLRRGYRISFKNDGLEDQILIGKFYKVTSSCGCDKEAVYSCFGNDIPTPLAFKYYKNNVIDVLEPGIDPNTSSAAIIFEKGSASDCFTSVILREQHVKTCLASLNVSGYRFELYINGVLQNSAGNTNFRTFADNITFNPGVIITSIVVRMVDPEDPCNQQILSWNGNNYDICGCQSSGRIDFTSITPDASVCSNGEIAFVVAGGDNSTTYTVDLYLKGSTTKLDTVTGTALTGINGASPVVIPTSLLYQTNTYTLVVSQDVGDQVCSYSEDVLVTCACEVDPPFIAYNCGTGDLTITVATGTDALSYDAASVQIKKVNPSGPDSTISNPTLDTGDPVTVVNFPSGLATGQYYLQLNYTVGGCDLVRVSNTLSVDCAGGENLDAYQIGCDTDAGRLIRARFVATVDGGYTLSMVGSDGLLVSDNASGAPAASRAVTITPAQVGSGVNITLKVANADIIARSLTYVDVTLTTPSGTTTTKRAALLDCDGSGDGFSLTTSFSCSSLSDLANITISTSVNNSYVYTITPDPFTGSGSYTGNFVGTNHVITGVIQGVTYDILVSSGTAAENSFISPSCTSPGPTITHTYTCAGGLTLFSNGAPLAGGTNIFIDGAPVVYNSGIIVAPGFKMISVPGSTPITVNIPNCCTNITFSYVVNCSPLSLDYTLGGGGGTYDVTFQGITYPGITDGTTNIAAPSTGTHIMSIYDTVNLCTTNKTVIISSCDATATIVEEPTCFTGDFGDGPIDQGKIYQVAVSGCDLGAITVDYGQPTSGGDQTTVSAWFTALSAGTNKWAFQYATNFDTCYEAFYIPGSVGPINGSCAFAPNGWYIPNGIWVRINVGAGSGCPTRTIYKYLTPSAMVPGCSECVGFFCS